MSLLLQVSLCVEVLNIVPDSPDRRVVGSKARLQDALRSLVGDAGAGEIAKLLKDEPQVADAYGDIGMVGAEGALVDGEGALEGGAGAGEIVKLLKDVPQVVDVFGGPGMVGAEGALVDGEGALQGGAGGAVVGDLREVHPQRVKQIVRLLAVPASRTSGEKAKVRFPYKQRGRASLLHDAVGLGGDGPLDGMPGRREALRLLPAHVSGHQPMQGEHAALFGFQQSQFIHQPVEGVFEALCRLRIVLRQLERHAKQVSRKRLARGEGRGPCEQITGEGTSRIVRAEALVAQCEGAAHVGIVVRGRAAIRCKRAMGKQVLSLERFQVGCGRAPRAIAVGAQVFSSQVQRQRQVAEALGDGTDLRVLWR